MITIKKITTAMKGKQTMDTITRRQFVRNGSMALTGIVATSMMPFGKLSTAIAGETQFIESSCGSQGKHILVAYESYCGSTSQMAQTIADTLCKQGARADVRQINNIKEISQYDGAVIGSAVRSASWYSEAIDFVNENKARLSQIPVAYFLSCLALYYDTKEAKKVADSYFEPILTSVPQVKPAALESFAGVLDYSKLNMVVKMVMKSKMKKQGIPEGDFRDFKKIENWTKKSVWPLFVKA